MSNSFGRETTGIGGIRIGTELNQTYMIDSLIGVGGMGEVFRGHNIQTGDPVAIKVVLPEFARDEMILDLFRKEARILNHLSHDAIVRYHVFTLDRTIGRPYLAMEYAGGPSLAERIKTGPLPEDDIAYLQMRLADGLQRAHEAGVIHRDISPDNVILPDGKVKSAKIIDFGIARSANVGGATLLGGSFAGKYNWVSPEQLGLFGGDVTPQSDIYSLGLVLAAGLRGTPIDMYGSQVEVIEKRRKVPDLSGMPPRFTKLLTAMLEPDPADRIKTMAEVRDFVLDLPPPKPVEAEDATVISIPGKKPVRPAQVSVPPALPKSSPHEPRIQPAEQSPTRSGLPRMLALAGALVTVIVLGVLGGLFFVDLGQNEVQDTAVVKESEPPVTEPEVTTPPTTAAQTETPPKTIDPEESVQNNPPVTAAKQAPETQPDVPEADPPQQVDPATRTAELKSLLQSFDAANCSYAEARSITPTSADLVAFSGDASQLAGLGDAFTTKAGFAPKLSSHVVSDAQCPVISAISQLSSRDASPLQLVMASESRTTAEVKNGNVIVEASILNAGPRNVSVLLATDDGGVQNINRICPKCLSISGDTLKVRVPLTPAPGSNPNLPERPVLLIAVASPRNLFSVSSQSIFNGADLIPDLVREVASAPDVSTAIGYFKF